MLSNLKDNTPLHQHEIAELGDINRFENIKQLNAFCGLDPTVVQSGKSINYNGPISKRGNRNARKILFITCCSIIRASVSHNVDNNILHYYRKNKLRINISKNAS